MGGLPKKMLSGETARDTISFLPSTDVASDSDDFATHIGAWYKVGFFYARVCTIGGYKITILLEGFKLAVKGVECV